MDDPINLKQIQATIAEILGEVTRQTASFLTEVLPSIQKDWWQQCVLRNLGTSQLRHIERDNIKTLEKLDLAALLRVLDQNWYEISSSLKLSRESRHFVKEMQTIRNHWAHMCSEGISREDAYRDLDTIQRFALVVDADDSLVKSIHAIKKSLITQETKPREQEIVSVPEAPENTTAPKLEFTIGQIVCLKSDSSKRGAVMSVIAGGQENRYNVFMDGLQQTFYASQLKADEADMEAVVSFPCDQFHAYLTALQIRHPALSTLYSLNAARVDFIPYQFRPVMRFIRSDRPRMLIADGVGVGKTIEAGLILRELQARRDIRSILIICPRPLVTERKWMNEMKRFEERFTHLDGPLLRYCIKETDMEGVWPREHSRTIIPYSLFDEALLSGKEGKGKGKRRTGLLDLEPPPRFDLVIVDEAHHIRNTNTFRHEGVKFFCENAEAVVFLTATPLQLDNQDLYVLLHTLRPDLILDWQSYTHMAAPNPAINRAISMVRSRESDWQSKALGALNEAAATEWGQAILKHNPEFADVCIRLQEGNVTNEERVQMITDIEGMHTFSGIINRTRRRDIGDFTVRRPETVAVDFTPSQREFHDDLLAIQAEILRSLHGNVSIKFMMTTIRRQAASCLYGLVPFLETILNRHIDELEWAEVDEADEVLSSDAGESIRDRIEEILGRAKGLDPYDPKLEALREILRKRQGLTNNKVMLFSSFRHTLYYLYDRLVKDGIRVGLVHGGTPDEERMEARNRFELPRESDDALDVLLFSEIGCEGLDYQFCACMVNYDLPWNPMRVEQRIGRIDRNGQKSESVAIFNMVTPGTVDAEIYYRCLVRIGVFESALGGSEEILGEITREIHDIADNPELTAEEREKKFQQLEDNEIRKLQEEEKLEDQQLELFGIRLPEDRMKKEIEGASSFWLTPASLRRMVTLYLKEVCGEDREFILGEKQPQTLRLDKDARNALLQHFQKVPKQQTSVWKDWEDWLKGGDQHLSITFESKCALDNPKAAFITPVHPLVKQAALNMGSDRRIVTRLAVQSNDVPAGRYEFAIYQWRFHGIREDLVLKPVASSDEITPHLTRLLEEAVDIENEAATGINRKVWDALDGHHYTLWAEARQKHCQRTRELAEFRRESLSKSHKARMALLAEQLEKATHGKIQRMKESQIASAEADYARRTQELEIAMERADIITEPVAYGILVIEEKTK